MKSIDFRGVGLEGSLPIELFNLTNLRLLRLIDCGLEGTLSPSVSKLTKVEIFEVSSTPLQTYTMQVSKANSFVLSINNSISGASQQIYRDNSHRIGPIV